MPNVPTCDLYLRQSDMRVEESLDGREPKLRAEAARLGWIVHRVVVENDAPRREGGKMIPASAFKRRIVRDAAGRPKLDPDTGRPIRRVIRPKWQSVIADLKTGRVSALLAEDLDRVCRDPRDLEDLIDACGEHGASARSLSGSLTFTDGGTDHEITTARLMVTVANQGSRDTRRRVIAKNETLNGTSYRGGPRPYGYVAATKTEKYHRNLLVVPDEAEVLRAAARDILAGLSLRAIARDLRERAVPTVTGTSWKPAILRNALIKPTVAGLALHRGQLKPAPWPAILERDIWERVKAVLEDPDRCTTTGNEPKWLLSGLAKCGVCGDGTTVKASGADLHNSGPGYTCTSGARHLRRSARYADDYIARALVGPPVDEPREGRPLGRLEMDDASRLLRPPPRPAGVNAAELRAEAIELDRRKKSQIRLHMAGKLSDADLDLGMTEYADRRAVIDAQLTVSDEPDPLAKFRGRPARAVWDHLSVAERRVVVRLLLDVTLAPATRRGPGFDPASVLVRYRV